MEIFAQVIGIFGMIANILSFQQKSQRGVIALQFFGSLLFSINFFMLGAYVGSMLNLIGIVRALVFYFKEKTHANHIAYLFAFSSLFILAYVLTFTAFGTEPSAKNLVIECLPVIAMIVATVAFRSENAGAIRRYGLIYSPMWLAYNLFNLSIGAIGCEVLNLASIIIGMIRLDKSKKNSNEIKK